MILNYLNLSENNEEEALFPCYKVKLTEEVLNAFSKSVLFLGTSSIFPNEETTLFDLLPKVVYLGKNKNGACCFLHSTSDDISIVLVFDNPEFNTISFFNGKENKKFRLTLSGKPKWEDVS